MGLFIICYDMDDKNDVVYLFIVFGISCGYDLEILWVIYLLGSFCFIVVCFEFNIWLVLEFVLEV